VRDDLTTEPPLTAGSFPATILVEGGGLSRLYRAWSLENFSKRSSRITTAARRCCPFSDLRADGSGQFSWTRKRPLMAGWQNVVKYFSEYIRDKESEIVDNVKDSPSF
jgi:hypothetical protein